MGRPLPSVLKSRILHPSQLGVGALVVGLAVGRATGWGVGLLVGLAVGRAVAGVGAAVGFGVGAAVGFLVGKGVGAGVVTKLQVLQKESVRTAPDPPKCTTKRMTFDRFTLTVSTELSPNALVLCRHERPSFVTTSNQSPRFSMSISPTLRKVTWKRKSTTISPPLALSSAAGLCDSWTMSTWPCGAQLAPGLILPFGSRGAPCVPRPGPPPGQPPFGLPRSGSPSSSFCAL